MSAIHTCSVAVVAAVLLILTGFDAMLEPKEEPVGVAIEGWTAFGEPSLVTVVAVGPRVMGFLGGRNSSCLSMVR